METDSPAPAETEVQQDGATPPAETTTTTTAAAAAAPAAAAKPTPESILEGDDVEAIHALMRENNGALVPTKPGEGDWKGFDEDDSESAPAPDPKPTDQTEAKPGEDPGAATEPADPPPATPPPKPVAEKNLTRVRINRFAEADRAIINRMALPENEGKTFDQVRTEMIGDGTLPAPSKDATPAPQAKAPVQAPVPDAAAEAITAQQAVIDGLEAEIDTAATAFDAPKAAKLQIAHNKAVAKLTQLEARAEAQRAQARQQARQTHAEQVTAAETQAVSLFADAGKPGTPLHDAIEDLMDAAPAEAFRDPDYPLTFAAKAAARLGIQPGAAPKPAPQVVPKKPARPVPVKPASGAEAAAGPAAKGPTVEEQIAKAEASNDVATLQRLLNEAGTKSVPR